MSWIDITKQRPEQHQKVLISAADGTVTAAIYEKRSDGSVWLYPCGWMSEEIETTFDYRTVTHWQPLPCPPEALNMTGTFLTDKELVELTGAKRKSNQIRWLTQHRYPHETNANGAPKVLRCYLERRL